MKKTLSIILAAVMVLSMLVVIPMTAAADEPAGTAINSEAEFLAMDPAGTYYLAQDIELTLSYGIPTEGTKPVAFTGTFDGNGKTVTISTNGLFLRAENATIKNVIINGDIAVDEAYTYAYGSAKYGAGYEYYAAGVVMATGKTLLSNIVSNVNIATDLKARYGGIAAASEKNHELLIENCVNNGNVLTADYAGGIFGWSSALGNSAIKGCVNNGEIHVTAGYCGGITSRLGGSGKNGRLTVENCINNGKITADASNACGIVQYSNTLITIKSCVNTGDVTAKGSAAGIHSSLAEIKAGGDNYVIGCINTGKITNSGTNYAAGIIANQANQKSKGVVLYVRDNINYGDVIQTAAKSNHVAGILAYVYGTSKDYSIVENNINYGTITLNSTGEHVASQILAYTNTNKTVIKNNMGFGKTVGSNLKVFVGLSSATITDYDVSGNYYIADSGLDVYSHAFLDDNAKNRLTLDQMPEGALNFIAAEEMNEYQVVKYVEQILLNVSTALNAGPADVEIKDGQIVFNGHTVFSCTHSYYAINGVCTACGSVLPFTGDSFPVVMIIGAMAVSFIGIVGVAIYFKKKKRIAE